MPNILVTGATGFIGRYLVNQLEAEKHIVFCVSSKEGDIRESRTFLPFLEKNIDVLYHLAGRSFVPESWDTPSDYIDINVNGTLQALEFCRKTSAKLIFISSYLYGNPSELPTSETANIQAPNPYALSKRLAEELVQGYGQLYSIPSVIIRPFNIYGPGQKSSFLIPELIQKFQSDSDNVEVLDLSPYRDYLFIDDLISLLVKASSLSGSHILNAGSGLTYSVKEIVETIKIILNSSKNISEKGQSRRSEIMETRADISLVKDKLNWEPQVSLEIGLSRCVKYY